MIKYVDGDLLQAEENIIGHSCNCKGVMGSGIALQIKHQFPKAYQEYEKYCRGMFPTELLLGVCQIVQIDEHRYVANLFGQDSYGYGQKHTNLIELKRALVLLRNMAKYNGLSVALPYKLGSDRGGEKWENVLQVIEEVFSDYDVTIYKYNG